MLGFVDAVPSSNRTSQLMRFDSHADARRGMEFLYSANRLNVATSRSKCICVVVAPLVYLRRSVGRRAKCSWRMRFVDIWNWRPLFNLTQMPGDALWARPSSNSCDNANVLVFSRRLMRTDRGEGWPYRTSIVRHFYRARCWPLKEMEQQR
jgi:hypothetical protein